MDSELDIKENTPATMCLINAFTGQVTIDLRSAFDLLFREQACQFKSFRVKIVYLRCIEIAQTSLRLVTNRNLRNRHLLFGLRDSNGYQRICERLSTPCPF